jgi:hypothetical protein
MWMELKFMDVLKVMNLLKKMEFLEVVEQDDLPILDMNNNNYNIIIKIKPLVHIWNKSKGYFLHCDRNYKKFYFLEDGTKLGLYPGAL